MDIPNTIVAMVHDRVGEALTSFLSGGDNPFFIRLSPADTLLAQLEDTSVTLPRVSAGFIGDIALSSVSGVVNKLRSLSQDSQASGGAGLPKLPNPADLVAQVRSALGRRLPFPPQQQDTNPEGVIESLVGILDREGQEIGFESAYDALRGLQSTDEKTGLFGTVTTRLRTRKQATADQEAVVTKFVTWFRGFSSMAESGAM